LFFFAEDCPVAPDSVCRALSRDPAVTVVGVGADYDGGSAGRGYLFKERVAGFS
jgi:hypothetical protein